MLGILPLWQSNHTKRAATPKGIFPIRGEDNLLLMQLSMLSPRVGGGGGGGGGGGASRPTGI